jgi:hypothetical protein
VRPSQRYLRDLKRLARFHDAFAEVMQHVHRVPTGMSIWELQPRPGHEAEFERAAALCANAAGAADEANRRHGGLIHTGRMGAELTLDPVRNWAVVLEQPWRLGPEDVLGLVKAAIGSAQTAAEDAQDQERGLAGLIARFVRLPLEVREAVGAGHVLGAAAYGTGFVVQVVIAAVGGALALLLAFGVTAAWDAVRGGGQGPANSPSSTATVTPSKPPALSPTHRP